MNILPDRRAVERERYLHRNILRSEWMYGAGFQSPGALTTVSALAERAPIPRSSRLLDIGSGLGGACLHFVTTMGCSAVGLDASVDMIALSNERLTALATAQNSDLETRVKFIHGDIRNYPLEAGAFDVAWTRDAMMYVDDKDSAWANIRRALRVGGTLIGSDFCVGEVTFSEEFQSYLDACDYHLQDLSSYSSTLEAAGFRVRWMEDASAWFIELLEQEAATFAGRREDFVTQFSKEEFSDLLARWKSKVEFTRAGELVWGLFAADAT